MIDNWLSEDGLKAFQLLRVEWGKDPNHYSLSITPEGQFVRLRKDSEMDGWNIDADLSPYETLCLLRDMAWMLLAERNAQVAQNRGGNWGGVRAVDDKWDFLHADGTWHCGLAGNNNAKTFRDYDEALVAAVMALEPKT